MKISEITNVQTTMTLCER